MPLASKGNAAYLYSERIDLRFAKARAGGTEARCAAGDESRVTGDLVHGPPSPELLSCAPRVPAPASLMPCHMH